MRRRRSSFRKEKAIMLASSCLVLTALTVTGLYVRNLGEEEPEENVVDFTALEDEEESLTMLGSQTGEDGQAAEGEGFVDGSSAEGEVVDSDSPSAGEAALTDEVLQDSGTPQDGVAGGDGTQEDVGRQNDQNNGTEGNVPQDGLQEDGGAALREEELAEAGGEEALAANASDAIARSDNADEEDADAMSASTLLDFSDSDALVWPIVGNVLVNYSMDKTVYFATLDQYKYSPAIVIAATEGEEITAAADGQVTDVFQDPETGTTVVMNLGDGYELTYGQLTDLAVAEGDMVVTGDPIGKVAAPTMYYSVEGTNVYFKLTKDGVPVDPMSRLG